MSRRQDNFYKFCHESRIFTSKNLSSLVKHGIIDEEDIISLIFLICDQPNDDMNRLVNINNSNFSGLDLYDIFQTFENWSRKFFEALICIDNKRALLELKINPATIESNSNTTLALSPSRVILYRIFENLSLSDASIFLKSMSELGAPCVVGESSLEICFMHWHLAGFLDIEKHQGFSSIAEALNYAGRPDLASTLGFTSQSTWFPDSSFNLEHCTEVYSIKDKNHPGLCIIINQHKYGNLKDDRRSSTQDVIRLRTTMASLNYSVVDYENVPAANFLSAVDQAISDNFMEHHSIVILIVMAHGGDGFISCPSTSSIKESNSYQNGSFDHSTNNLKTEKSTGPLLDFKSNVILIADIQNRLMACENLRSVPKIVMFNSCRGKDVFKNKEYFQQANYVADEFHEMKSRGHVDLITCYTTLSGNLNFCDAHQGSLFMQVFCDILSHKPEIEVCKLFTLINSRLMQPTSALSKDFEVGSILREQGVANPCDFTSCLTKKLYLKLPS